MALRPPLTLCDNECGRGPRASGGTVRAIRVSAVVCGVATALGVLVGPATATAAQPPSTPVLSSLSPGDTQVGLAWQPSTSESPDTLTYAVDVRLVSDDSEVASALTAGTSYSATGLTNGVDYRIDVTPQDASGVGEPLHVTGRPGKAPEQPVLTSVPAPNTLHVEATALDYGYTPSWTFRLTPRQGGGPDTVIESSQPVVELPDYDRVGYTVTAVATNYFGDSVTSAPVIARPLTVPGAPRQVWWDRHGQRYTVHWLAPRDDGGVPITRYRVDLGPRHVYFASAEARSLQLPLLPAGRTFSVQVYARNALGRTEIPSYDASLGTDIGVLTGIDGVGRARWRWSTSSRWHGLGGRLAAPPSAARAAGHMWFVGSTPAGALVGRTPSTPWRKLSPSVCRQAYAGRAGAGGLDVFCVNNDQRGVEAALCAGELRTVTPSISAREWAAWTDGRRRLSRFAASIGEIGIVTIAARVAPYDAAGDNLLVRQPYSDPQWRRVRHLHCAGPPAAGAGSGGLFVACIVGPHRVAWVTDDGGLSVHRATTPVPVRSALGAVLFYDAFGQLSVVGRGGGVWLLDVGQRRWWRAGTSTTAPLRFSRWTS